MFLNVSGLHYRCGNTLKTFSPQLVIMPKWISAEPPSLKIKPPFIFLISFVVGLLIHFFLFPWPIIEDSLVTTGIGIVLLVAGFSFVLWAFRTFDAHEVSRKFQPVKTLVKTGPFARTRNPMYVSLITIYLGISIIFNTLIPIILLPFTIIFLKKYVIMKEEAYLEKLFGKEYTDYKARVRRWV